MKAIISFLTFIVEGIARAVVFLLSTLGLWIPALFCLLFVIICAVTQTAFAEVSGIFFVGLALSVVLALSITVARVLRKREKKHLEKNGMAPRSLKRKKDKNKSKSDNPPQSQFISPNIVQPNVPSGYAPVMQQGYYPYGYYGGGYSQQPYGAPPAPGYNAQPGYNNAPGYNAQPGYNNASGYNAQPGYNNASGYNAQPGYNNAPGYNAQPGYNNASGYNAPSGYNNAQPGYNGYHSDAGADNGGGRETGESMFEQAKRSMRAEFAGYNPPSPQQDVTPSDDAREKPLGIFRTRSDPSILIYEYADRLDFWRRTDGGRLEYVRTETKRACQQNKHIDKNKQIFACVR